MNDLILQNQYFIIVVVEKDNSIVSSLFIHSGCYLDCFKFPTLFPSFQSFQTYAGIHSTPDWSYILHISVNISSILLADILVFLFRKTVGFNDVSIIHWITSIMIYFNNKLESKNKELIVSADIHYRTQLFKVNILVSNIHYILKIANQNLTNSSITYIFTRLSIHLWMLQKLHLDPFWGYSRSQERIKVEGWVYGLATTTHKKTN